MGQRTQHGYLFLMQVLFRPVLMVIGFVMSVILMSVMGKFFFATFSLATGDAGTIGSWYDLVGFVVSVAVFFTTSVMIVNICTNLIHLIPDAVMQWVGSSSASGGAGSRMQGEFAAASGGVAGVAGSLTSGGGAGNKMADTLGNARKTRDAKAGQTQQMGQQQSEAEQMNKEFDKARDSKPNGATASGESN